MKDQAPEKMRVSFDLDEVLFVSEKTHKTGPPLRFPLNHFYKERLRLGTPDVVNTLQRMGYEVWVYTSSFRSEKYIRNLFRCYGVRFDGIVNGDRHLKEVQRNSKTLVKQRQLVLGRIGDPDPAPRFPLVDFSKPFPAFPISDHLLAPPFIVLGIAQLILFP